MPDDLLKTMQERANEERRRSDDAARNFATILDMLRRESGSSAESDPELLRTAAEAVGLGEADLGNLREVIRQEAALLQKIDGIAELEEQHKTASCIASDYAAEQERIRLAPIVETNRLAGIARQTADSLVEARKSANRLTRLYAENWRLFGLREPAKPEAPQPLGTVYHPENARPPEVRVQNLGDCYPVAAVSPIGGKD